jgi:hypothetical protein
MKSKTVEVVPFRRLNTRRAVDPGDITLVARRCYRSVTIVRPAWGIEGKKGTCDKAEVWGYLRL